MEIVTYTRRLVPLSFAGLMCALAAIPLAVAAQSRQEEEKTLRVCADPNNLPLSNRKGEGYENKIAELFAQDLGWALDYTFFPQRMGFIRNTLRAREQDNGRYKCDLVVGVPVGFELTATTKPYLRSTYALAYLKGRGLDGIRAPEDLLKLDSGKLKILKFGVFGRTPPADWLLKHKLLDRAVPYQPQTGDPEQYPGEIIEKDLIAGKIDVAFVWGPIAGYFGKRVTSAKVEVVPFKPDPEIKFDYSIAMGVRFGERDWKERVDRFLESSRERIQAILTSYGVPQLNDQGEFIGATPASPSAALPPQ